MENTTFIYALCEPNTRTIRYIGKADDPEKRLLSHLYNAGRKKSRVGNWILSLVGLSPALLVLKEVQDADWQEWEKSYISNAKMLGFDLTNLTDGGEGGAMLPEIQKKASEARRGQKQLAETCAKKGAARTGEKHPLFGKPVSQETRDKISFGSRNRIRLPWPEEVREKISASVRLSWAKRKGRGLSL